MRLRHRLVSFANQARGPGSATMNANAAATTAARISTGCACTQSPNQPCGAIANGARPGPAASIPVLRPDGGLAGSESYPVWFAPRIIQMVGTVSAPANMPRAARSNRCAPRPKSSGSKNASGAGASPIIPGSAANHHGRPVSAEPPSRPGSPIRWKIADPSTPPASIPSPNCLTQRGHSGRLGSNQPLPGTPSLSSRVLPISSDRRTCPGRKGLS
ncbi:hypothetical protein GCM10023321_81100 [Pseudonocardia eucalypti]|uniref:Uncharacterized protein n=1 Tax=Pseudonocardia eucalypti TaxID=648755 RepID=A0ABP9RDS4_9PSEU